MGRSHGNSCLDNIYCRILPRRKVRLPKVRLCKGGRARTLSNIHAALPGPSSARTPHAPGTQVTSSLDINFTFGTARSAHRKYSCSQECPCGKIFHLEATSSLRDLAISLAPSQPFSLMLLLCLA